MRYFYDGNHRFLEEDGKTKKTASKLSFINIFIKINSMEECDSYKAQS